MSNKTFGFVVKSADIQKAVKQAKSAPFLSAKQRTPFRLHPRPILGKIKNSTPIFVLRGSHSHEMALLFWMTILSTILVPVEKDTARRPTTKKCGSPLRRSPVWGLSFAKAGFRSFLLDFEVFEDFLHCFLGGCHQHCFDKSHRFLF